MPTVEDLLTALDERDEPPAPPPSGIPPQRLPAWIRWPLRVFLLPFIWLDQISQKVAKKIIRPPFKREGACLKRGKCCHYILIPEPKGILGKAYLFVQQEVNGFYLRSPEPYESDEGEKVLVLGCRYLQKDGKCAHYALRPTVCREWPKIEYFGKPRMLKGCGFRAVPRR